jgi:probable HAF family extracellular repeat protein
VLKPVLFFLAAIAAFGKQTYHSIPIPVPPGQVAEPLALNDQGQALVKRCTTAVSPECVVFLWTERGPSIEVFHFSGDTLGGFLLNDWGQVAAVRSVNPPQQTIVLWSQWDGSRDIATLPQGGVSIVALNNLGVVLGKTAAGAFVAARGLGAQFIPALAGNVEVRAMNDLGVITGALNLPCQPGYCLTTVAHAFVWTPWGGLRDLETRPPTLNPSSIGLAVNLKGDVSGNMYAGTSQQAFLWTQKDGRQVLSPAPNRITEFRRINDHDEIVGQWYYGSAGIRTWFKSDKGISADDIGTLGGTQAYARDLNNQGEIVGYSSPPNGTPDHAFIWSARDGIADLGPGAPTAINDHGLILGKSGGNAVVWTK